MPEGVPSSEANSLPFEQLEQIARFLPKEKVVGLAIGGTEPEDGWEFVGLSDANLVSLVKKEQDGGLVTRDLTPEQFLALNSEQ